MTNDKTVSPPVLMLFTLVLCASCGGGTGQTAPDAPASPAAAPKEPIQQKSTAPATAIGEMGSSVVVGTVRYEGKVPTLRPIQMDADPGCAKKHASPPVSEMLVLGEDNALANVFVFVQGGLAGRYPAAEDPVVLDQKGCRYEPHILGVMVGQPLKILNSDGLLHNVHALPDINPGFNGAMPASVTELVKRFDKPEPMFKIKCDVHPWMGAYVAVLEHPFFDVSADSGSFRIEGLPAGSYEIGAWHEKLGTRTVEVSLTGSDSKTVDFVFSR